MHPSSRVPGNAYTVGFAFSEDLTSILLIKKDRPAWQSGLYNGVGGRIEEGETPQQAMAREFYEEVDIVTLPDKWELFHNVVETASGQRLMFYTCTLPVAQLASMRKKTSEVPTILWVKDIIGLEYNCRAYTPAARGEQNQVVYNIPWLVLMAISWIKYPAHRYTEVGHDAL